MKWWLAQARELVRGCVRERAGANRSRALVALDQALHSELTEAGGD
jgi:hypothetical protein